MRRRKDENGREADGEGGSDDEKAITSRGGRKGTAREARAAEAAATPPEPEPATSRAIKFSKKVWAVDPSFPLPSIEPHDVAYSDSDVESLDLFTPASLRNFTTQCRATTES
jgi:hypothetical protein